MHYLCFDQPPIWCLVTFLKVGNYFKISFVNLCFFRQNNQGKSFRCYYIIWYVFINYWRLNHYLNSQLSNSDFYIYYILCRHYPQMLTEDFLKNLYLNSSLNIRLPKLQLLNFELSELNQNEIIIRLSDGKSFIDSPLSGPYKVINGQIVSEELYQNNKIIQKYDIITIDYFSKIDKDKMCNLQLIIRRIDSVSNSGKVIGAPQQISQHIENQNKNIYPFLANANFSNPFFKIQNAQSLNQQNWNLPPAMTILVKSQKISENSNSKKKGKGKSETQSLQPGFQNFLDLNQIESNKQGLFIGRLVRVKSGTRELKEGGSFITVLYLGFIDLNNNLVRISLVGKNALRQQQHLMKYQVYTIKGIQNTSLDRTRFIYYLKLKDKQYNIKRITQQPYISVLPRFWFHFDHEPSKQINIGEENQIEVVDVIGVVDQIDDKITYKNIHSFQEERNVIRVTVRNVHKSIKISFWAEQIKMLEACQLKKYDEVIMCDLKKKKNIFLDFTIESNLIKLKDQPQLREVYAPLLPQFETMQEPQNIKQLIQYFENEINKSKVKHLSVYMMKIYQNKVVFKICEECRKKIDREETKCPDCGCLNSLYKFNCLIDFVDYSGSLKCVSFDPTTEKILSISANELNQMSQDRVRQFFQKYSYNHYQIGIECKNDRFVLRTIQPIDNSLTQTKSNLQKIQQIKKQKDFRHLL